MLPDAYTLLHHVYIMSLWSCHSLGVFALLLIPRLILDFGGGLKRLYPRISLRANDSYLFNGQ